MGGAWRLSVRRWEEGTSSALSVFVLQNRDIMGLAAGKSKFPVVRLRLLFTTAIELQHLSILHVFIRKVEGAHLTSPSDAVTGCFIKRFIWLLVLQSEKA